MYEGLVCVCCLASDEEQLLDLFPPEQGGDDYSRLLLDCFKIEVSGLEGHSHVCSTCAGRLRDTADFVRQIRTALALLSSTYSTSPSKKPKSLNDKKGKYCLRVRLISKEKPENVIAKDGKKQRHGRRVSRKKPIYVVPEGVRLRKSHVRPTANNNPIILNERNIYPAYKASVRDLACRECTLVFNNHHGLQRHMNEHFQNYGCRHCVKAFMTMDSWRRHQRTHDKGAFPCLHCDRVFSNQNTRMSHTRYRHSALPSHLCRECGARFHTFHQRAKHMGAEHGLPGPYPCPNCAETFVAYRSRHRHLQSGRCPMMPSSPAETEVQEAEATESNNGDDYREINYTQAQHIHATENSQTHQREIEKTQLANDISQAELPKNKITKTEHLENYINVKDKHTFQAEHVDDVKSGTEHEENKFAHRKLLQNDNARTEYVEGKTKVQYTNSEIDLIEYSDIEVLEIDNISELDEIALNGEVQNSMVT